MTIVTARTPKAIDRERHRKAHEAERREFAAVLRERQAAEHAMNAGKVLRRSGKAKGRKK